MKRILTLIFIPLLLLSLAFSAGAAQARVIDQAGILSADEIATLEQQAQDIADEFQMDAVILTVTTLNGGDIEAYAEQYYDENGYGIGAEYDGIIMVVSTEDRELAISTCGGAANAIPDWVIDDLLDAVIDHLSEGDYYSGYRAFFAELPGYFREYSEPYVPDFDTQEQSQYQNRYGFRYFLGKVVSNIPIGALVAIVAVWLMSRQMHTAKAQSGAKSYMVEGSYDLYNRRDTFLYSRVSRVRRNTDSGSSGGGSRSSGGGGGRSHRTRSGKF